MESLELIKWIITVGLSVGAFFFKRTLDSYDEKVKKHEKEITDIKEKYLHKDDFKEFKQELRGMFEDIKADIRDIKGR